MTQEFPSLSGLPTHTEIKARIEEQLAGASPPPEPPPPPEPIVVPPLPSETP